MAYTPKTWAQGDMVNNTDTNRWEVGIDEATTAVSTKAETTDVPSFVGDLGGFLLLAQLFVDGVKMVVFNTTTQTWQSNPAEGRLDIHIIFVGGDAAHPPPAIAGRDIWLRPVP